MERSTKDFSFLVLNTVNKILAVRLIFKVQNLKVNSPRNQGNMLIRRILSGHRVHQLTLLHLQCNGGAWSPILMIKKAREKHLAKDHILDFDFNFSASTTSQEPKPDPFNQYHDIESAKMQECKVSYPGYSPTHLFLTQCGR